MVDIGDKTLGLCYNRTDPIGDDSIFYTIENQHTLFIISAIVIN